MAEWEQIPVDTPCIGVCEVDHASGLCRGCSRTIAEITHWWRMTATERREVYSLIELRKEAAAGNSRPSGSN